MTKRTVGCVLLGGLLMAGVSVQAHHSLAGVYDMKKEAEVSGSVEKVQFVNPHGSLTLAVKEADGTMKDWVFTLGSATALAQRGIGRTGPNALHAGDMISVKFIPARSGAPLGFLKSVTMPDGRVVQISAGNAND
ncbi:MAG TPA: DUF6152 family protein [Vicinamibacterales bacterium]|jgi:uncharacterized protein DUF6152|nr:DUF6152 family protein [Vicinamibacterales bacterium]